MSFTTDFNHLPAMIEALDKTLADVVKATAAQVASDGSGNAPVLTGTLAASMYYTTDTGETTYSPSGGTHDMPPMETPPGGDGVHTADVGSSVDYGIDVEMGTHDMAAEPYMVPAAESNRDGFTSSASSAIGSALEALGEA